MYSLIRANRRIVAMAVVMFIIPLAVFAYTSPGKPTGFVNDFAGMMSAGERQAVEAKLSAFEKTTGNEISVVTVPNLGGDTVENFAVELFKEWGIGKKNKDNGVLLLISRDDREMRIEVGYGLEGALTDAEGFWILNKELAPAFRDGKYYDGINAAVDKIAFAINGEIIIPSEDAPTRSNSSSLSSFDLIWISFFVLLWISSILARSKSWWAGGVVGGVASVIIAIIKGFLYTGIIAFVILIPAGLLFDFFVSRAYLKSKASGTRPPWWIGGGGRGGHSGFGGGGGFGGFGGGSSGGGGASSRW